MDNQFIVIGIVVELILFCLLLITIKNSKKMRSKQPSLPKEIIKNLKFK